MGEIRNTIEPKNGLDKIKFKNTITKNIKALDREYDNETVVFNFNKFKFDSIDISGEFNNHYKNQEHYLEIITLLISEVLPGISKEPMSDLLNGSKSGIYRFHRIEDKSDGIRKILSEYSFPEQVIEDIIYGNMLYQTTIRKGRTAPRLVIELLGNVISPLFIDTNHHVYFNPNLANENINYEFFPIHCMDECSLLENMGDCILLDFLDMDKYKETLKYNCDANCTCIHK